LIGSSTEQEEIEKASNENEGSLFIFVESTLFGQKIKSKGRREDHKMSYHWKEGSEESERTLTAPTEIRLEGNTEKGMW